MIFIYLLAACRVCFFGIVLNTELGGSHTLKTTTVALLSHIGAFFIRTVGRKILQLKIR